MDNVAPKNPPGQPQVPGVMARQRRWVNHVKKRPVPKVESKVKEYLTLAQARQRGPLGFVTGRGSGVACVDLDHVIVDGEVVPEKRGLVEALCALTYVEVSPGGTGLHAWVLYDGRHKKVVNEHGEFFVDTGYVTFTGKHFAGSRDDLGRADALLARFFPLDATPKPQDTSPPVEPTPEVVERVKSALAALDPDMVEPEWARVGMALTELGEAGFDLWDEWSQGGKKYGGTHERWSRWAMKGEKERTVNLGTLFRMAREAGWVEVPPEKEFTPVNEEESSLPLAERYVYITVQDKFFDREHKVLLTPSAVDRKHLKQLQDGDLLVPQRNKKGEVQHVPPKSAHQFFGRHSPQVEQVVWWPGQPEQTIFQGYRCVNLYKAPEDPQSLGGDASAWLRHVEYLIPKKEEREHFLDWLAYLVQNLDGKVHHAMVLYGPQGTGKDAVLEPLRRWLDGRGWRGVSLTELQGSFQHYLAATKLLAIQEAKELEWGKSQHLYNEFKGIISSPDVLRVNMKNVQPFAVPNVVQVVITTNYQNGVYYEEENDRRYFVVECVKERRDEAYYTAYWAWVEEGWRGAIGWLAQRDLSKFLPGAQPPMTKAKQEMHAATRPVAEQEAASLLDEHERGAPYTLSELRFLAAALHPTTQRLFSPASGTSLVSFMEKRGWVQSKFRDARLWHPKAMAKEDALALYRARQDPSTASA